VLPVQSMGAPHGLVFMPQSWGPQVGGVQHSPSTHVAVPPSPPHVLLVQFTGTPVHGSAFMPQSLGPHVTGAQHAPASHVSAPLLQLQLSGFPHESLLVPHVLPLQVEVHVHSLFTHD